MPRSTHAPPETKTSQQQSALPERSETRRGFGDAPLAKGNAGPPPLPPGFSLSRVSILPDLPVQMRASSEGAAAGARSGGSEQTAAIAASGLQGAGRPLPYLDQLQRSFGRHDLSGVRSFSGQAARRASEQLGAMAFTRGNRVAFRDHSPSLYVTAHEAAHVIQQQSGIHLKGGVGAVGDIYERHADEVAAAVVRGQSAESILDQHAGPTGASGGDQVQLLAVSVKDVAHSTTHPYTSGELEVNDVENLVTVSPGTFNLSATAVGSRDQQSANDQQSEESYSIGFIQNLASWSSTATYKEVTVDKTNQTVTLGKEMTDEAGLFSPKLDHSPGERDDPYFLNANDVAPQISAGTEVHLQLKDPPNTNAALRYGSMVLTEFTEEDKFLTYVAIGDGNYYMPIAWVPWQANYAVKLKWEYDEFSGDRLSYTAKKGAATKYTAGNVTLANGDENMHINTKSAVKSAHQILHASKSRKDVMPDHELEYDVSSDEEENEQVNVFEKHMKVKAKQKARLQKSKEQEELNAKQQVEDKFDHDIDKEDD